MSFGYPPVPTPASKPDTSMIVHVYSTYCLREQDLRGQALHVRLFTIAQGQRGQGFHRPLQEAETNMRMLPPFELAHFRAIRPLRMEWDIFPETEISGDLEQTLVAATAAEQHESRKGYPLELRPAGLLVYGTLKLDLTQIQSAAYPLTSGLPCGSLQDDLLLCGGVDLSRSGFPSPWPGYPSWGPREPFAVLLNIKSGYWPTCTTNIRVHLQLECIP